jgi:hypothetical protein
LIKKIILGHEKANTVWARKKGREEIASQSHPSKVRLSNNPLGQQRTRDLTLNSPVYAEDLRNDVKMGERMT